MLHFRNKVGVTCVSIMSGHVHISHLAGLRCDRCQQGSDDAILDVWYFLRCKSTDQCVLKLIGVHALISISGGDPPGIKLRAAKALEAVDYFVPGYWVFSKMVQSLADIGYDNNNLVRDFMEQRCPAAAEAASGLNRVDVIRLGQDHLSISKSCRCENAEPQKEYDASILCFRKQEFDMGMSGWSYCYLWQESMQCTRCIAVCLVYAWLVLAVSQG